MRIRGQFAVEMFFAFTFAILLVFWMVNYLETFSTQSESVAAHTAQNVLTRDIGRIVNDVCVYGGSPLPGAQSLRVSMISPCLEVKQISYFYNVSRKGSDIKVLTVFSDITNTTTEYATACNLKLNANYSRCSPLDQLCIYKSFDTAAPAGYYVHIDTGACN